MAAQDRGYEREYTPEDRYEQEAGGKRPRPFRFAERCLYDYQENVARLELLRGDLRRLSSISVTNYEVEGAPSIGAHSDPVWAYVQRVSDLEEEITSLARRTEPIMRLVADLEASYVLQGSPKADMLKVLKTVYFGKNTKDQAADALGMARKTLYRIRNELVALAIRYLGF